MNDNEKSDVCDIFRSRFVKVLMVDDDTVTISLLSDIIEDIGHEVESRQNAYAAIDYLKNNDCDILISDVEMPGMSGLELAQWASIFCKQTRIVLMSGSPIDPAAVPPGAMTCRKPLDYAMIRAALGPPPGNA